MPIIQINLWICEVCGKTYSTTEEIAVPFSDPVVYPPNNEEWGYVGNEEKLACPACMRANKAVQPPAQPTPEGT